MSKLKSIALHNVNAASKEGTLLYFQFCQILIEHYSHIPYESDALNAYAHLVQGEQESIVQYLTRAEVLLECIHHNSQMSDIPGIGYDRFYLVRGMCSPHAQQRFASKQDTWCSMEDVFQTKEHITRLVEWNRAFFNPNLETWRPTMQVNEVSYGKATWQYKSDCPHNGQPHPAQFNNIFRENSKQPRGPFGKAQDNKPINTVLKR